MTTSANGITKPERKYTVTNEYNEATGGNDVASSDANYVFGGYYTEPEGAGTQYIDANGFLTSAATNTFFAGAGTLYAKWTSDSVTLPTPTKGGTASLGALNNADIIIIADQSGSAFIYYSK